MNTSPRPESGSGQHDDAERPFRFHVLRWAAWAAVAALLILAAAGAAVGQLSLTVTAFVVGAGLYWVVRDHARRLASLHRARDDLERNVAALATSEQRLSLALEAAGLASFDWNVASGEVCHSARWNEMLGGEPKPGVVSAAALAELTHPEDRARRRAAVVATLKGEDQAYRVEHRVRRHDGAWLWVQSHGRVVASDAAGRALRLIGTMADITQRKHAEEALGEERKLLRAVIDNLPELVFVKDLECRVVLANAAWIDVRMKGDASILGRCLSEVDSQEIALRSEEEDREVFRSGRPSRERELELEDARGERRCYVSRKTPLRDATGSIIGLVGIIRDITEDKQHVEDLARFTAGLEARVRERTAQLERANRELEAFTFSVSHDLRAPLRAIDGFSERVLVESAGRLSPKAEGYVQRVRLASQRMTRLIDNLLELSHTGRRELHRRNVDLSAMALEIGAEMREAEPGRNVRFTVQPGIAAVADGELLRIVLDNLLRNAWKFTSARAQAEVEVGWERRDGTTVYFVRDNGAGFDMRRAGRLFAPFQRLHRAAEFPGTGIGLAVAQRVVRRHLGEIWAQAVVDRGATFYFTLDAGNSPGIPAEAAAAAAHAPAPAQPAAPGWEPAAADLPAVLVVDDDEAVLEILREELGRDGHLILTAPDGAAGLEILERSNVGVVVSDYSMPGMTGTEFLGAVRERHPGVVRILYTSRPDARVLSDAVNEGGISYLVEKDWDRLYLRARVRESVIAAARRG